MLGVMGRLATVALLITAIGAILDGWVLWIYGAWNLVVAVYYAFDKFIAVRNGEKRRQGARISESRLLWLAALFGAGGALVSMLIFWHKVRKRPFIVAVPLLLLVQVALLWWLGRQMREMLPI